MLFRSKHVDFSAMATDAWLNRQDVNGYHSAMAAHHKNPAGANVLVVGCNRGEDCKPFIEWGASNVAGLDVMDEIGNNFRHRNVEYFKVTAEAMPFRDSEFDLVFSVATLEHVNNIFAAFREMGRVCKHNGIIYCVAAPLWNCRSGPHWGEAFNDNPWPHLRMSEDEIIEFCEKRHARDSGAPYFEPKQMRYYLDPQNFNMRPARDYLAATWSIPSIDVIENKIDLEDESTAPAEMVIHLQSRGFSRQELFGLSHLFVARKL